LPALDNGFSVAGTVVTRRGGITIYRDHYGFYLIVALSISNTCTMRTTLIIVFIY
jgi:hypothetical protein